MEGLQSLRSPHSLNTNPGKLPPFLLLNSLIQALQPEWCPARALCVLRLFRMKKAVVHRNSYRVVLEEREQKAVLVPQSALPLLLLRNKGRDGSSSLIVDGRNAESMRFLLTMASPSPY